MVSVERRRVWISLVLGIAMACSSSGDRSAGRDEDAGGISASGGSGTVDAAPGASGAGTGGGSGMSAAVFDGSIDASNATTLEGGVRDGSARTDGAGMDGSNGAGAGGIIVDGSTTGGGGAGGTTGGTGGTGGTTGGTGGTGGMPTCAGNTPQSGSCNCGFGLGGLGGGGAGGSFGCQFSEGTTVGVCDCIGNCGFGAMNGYGQWCCHTACPATEPGQGSDCYAGSCGGGGGTGPGCRYGSRDCACTPAGTWNCGLSQCPAILPPTDGSDCTGYQEGLRCDYYSASERCSCDSGTHSWQCHTCPTSAPQIGSACNGYPPVCSYPDGTCACDQISGVWSCALTCPPTKPTGGTGCQLGGQSCEYGSDTCTCDYSTGIWYCGTCPSRPPPEGMDCSTVGPIGCTYPAGSCACTTPPASTWSCNIPCPALEPVVGSSCSDLQPGMACPYAYEMCSCNAADDTWQCLTCPAAMPMHGDDCTGYPDLCQYGYEGCSCDRVTHKWSCWAPCAAPTPVDGAACNGFTGWCQYGSGQCSCDGNNWICDDCATPPPQGGDCAGLEGHTCGFGAGSCMCNSGTWDCLCPGTLAEGADCSNVTADFSCITYNPEVACTCDSVTAIWQNCETCPATQPTPGAACPGFEGLKDCFYDPSSCSCLGPTWTWSCN